MTTVLVSSCGSCNQAWVALHGMTSEVLDCPRCGEATDIIRRWRLVAEPVESKFWDRYMKMSFIAVGLTCPALVVLGLKLAFGIDYEPIKFAGWALSISGVALTAYALYRRLKG